MSKKTPLLKPAQNAASSISFRIPADLATRLARVRTASQSLGLVLDIDTGLTKSLMRLVKQAESELAAPMPSATLAAEPLSDSVEVPHV